MPRQGSGWHFGEGEPGEGWWEGAGLSREALLLEPQCCRHSRPQLPISLLGKERAWRQVWFLWGAIYANFVFSQVMYVGVEIGKANKKYKV